MLQTKLVKPKAVEKFKREPVPGKYKQEKVKAALMKLVDEISKRYGLSQDAALDIAVNDAAFKQILGYEYKYTVLQMINEVKPKLLEAVKKKADSGWTANARDGMTALAILIDKAFKEDTETTKLNIGGKNVQINLGFGFKPYKKKERKT